MDNNEQIINEKEYDEWELSVILGNLLRTERGNENG
jgi:hypothetical protein